MDSRSNLPIDGKRRREQAAKDLLRTLSKRELEVLKLVVEGRSNVEIGRALDLSSKTVATYRSRMMEKLRIDNLPELVKFAIRAGVTSIY